MQKPDALMIPESAADGPVVSKLKDLDKIKRICGIAEPILGLDRDKGEFAYARHQKRQKAYFVSGDVKAQLYHPHDSELAGKPRYRWEPVGELQYGYLIDAA